MLASLGFKVLDRGSSELSVGERRNARVNSVDASARPLLRVGTINSGNSHSRESAPAVSSPTIDGRSTADEAGDSSQDEAGALESDASSQLVDDSEDSLAETQDFVVMMPDDPKERDKLILTLLLDNKEQMRRQESV